MSESKTIPNKLPYAMEQSSCVSFSDKKLVKTKQHLTLCFLESYRKENCIIQLFMMFVQLQSGNDYGEIDS